VRLSPLSVGFGVVVVVGRGVNRGLSFFLSFAPPFLLVSNEESKEEYF